MTDKSRYRDLARLLPWLGLFLFTPPVLFLFRPALTIAGVPVLPVYLFGLWFALILASRFLTGHLVEEAEPPVSSRPDHAQRKRSSETDEARS